MDKPNRGPLEVIPLTDSAATDTASTDPVSTAALPAAENGVITAPESTSPLNLSALDSAGGPLVSLFEGINTDDAGVCGPEGCN